jgi:diguanylate cyclase (GGDEF)-like protein
VIIDFTLTEAAILMSRPLPVEGSSQSFAELNQAVLDALPEALFLFGSDSGEIRPLNAAATKWMPPRRNGNNACSVDELLPELILAKLLDCESGFHLCRAIAQGTNLRRDVVLHVYPLIEPSTRFPEAHSPQMVLSLRAVCKTSDANEIAGPDAFHDAFHDPLTQLPNRRLFHRRLERSVQRAGRSGYHFAVLFVDLDRFKSVNDRFGHTLGDHLLISASHRVVEAVRPQDMVARRDGDEFTILLDDLEHPEDAVSVAQRIVDYLQLPLSVDTGTSETTTVEIGASIGIAIGADGTLTAEQLIAQADAAMYHAKSLGGGVFLARQRLGDYRSEPLNRKKPLPR